jgi:hypothetical protein
MILVISPNSKFLVRQAKPGRSSWCNVSKESGQIKGKGRMAISDNSSQQELGILSQRRTWIDFSDFDHPPADGADLK